jgi:hypothetical protein
MAAACPANEFRGAGVVCRASAGDCDVEETCSGSQANCPVNTFASTSVVCREAAGTCDVEERCSGQGATCPTDRLASTTVVCRAAAGVCDLDERCTGNGVNCPANDFRSASNVCRVAASDCDVAETCSGSAAACPSDLMRMAGAVCSSSGGTTCDGQGHCEPPGSCGNGTSTRVTGTVYMPNGVDPLPNTLVYIPSATVQPFTVGVTTCQHCSTLVSGAPIAQALTDSAGRFTLTNVPAGAQVPLVIQNGKWRRQFELPNVTACAETTAGHLSMPSSRAEGDVPKIALMTGGFGAYECVLLKMGLSPQEFGNAEPARVRFFTSDGNRGARIDDTTPSEAQLWNTPGAMKQFDLVIFGCEGSFFPRTPDARQALLDYVNSGGHALINHYTLEWMRNVQPLWGTANWNFNQSGVFASDPAPATIDTSFPEGDTLAQWLSLVSPGSTTGQVMLSHLYADFDGVVPPSRLWMSLPDANHPNPVPMQYSFATPVGASPGQQCGAVLYTGFHTMEHFPGGTIFPAACSNNPMRPDEKLIAYMLFEQGRCH